MQSKEKNAKTICTENKAVEIPLPAEIAAEIAGVSVSLVKQVRTGFRSAETPKGSKVEVVDELWEHGSNLLINEIKKVVNL